jgi:hypothetical protein
LFTVASDDEGGSNKADFYTLFVALATLLRTSDIAKSQFPGVRRRLKAFAEEINLRLADDEAKVSKEASSYVRAVEKGVNDKTRRADRQNALIKVISKYFKIMKSPRG